MSLVANWVSLTQPNVPFDEHAMSMIEFAKKCGLMVACFAILGSQVAAQDISSQNPEGVANLLRERGQTAIVTVDEFNDPFIETSAGNADYNIIFYGCQAHKSCTSFSLRAQRMSNGSASFEAMNTWNTEQRWTKLYTADIHSAILEMDFLFAQGPMDEPVFNAHLDIWDRSLREFVRYIDEGEYDFVE